MLPGRFQLLVQILVLATSGRLALAQTPALPAGLVSITPPKPMPGFTLPMIGQSALDSGTLRGKVVVLRFWATH
jgi:hypothetical protein